MDKFEKFLEAVKDADPAMEAIQTLYEQLQMRHGQPYKPLVMPNSVRSYTVDPRSGLANKIVPPSIDGMGAPTAHCTSSMASTKSNTRTENMPRTEPKLFKAPRIPTEPNKIIKNLMKKSPANNVNPIALTKTYSQQVPVCGYSVKTGSTGLTGSYVPGVDAGYSAGGGGGGGAAPSGGGES